MKLKGCVALITGGTSGIGLAVAKVFLEEGAKVTIVGTSAEKGRNAAEQLGGKDQEVSFIRADVSKERDVRRLIERIVSEFGRIDILFNNAGIIIGKVAEELTEKEWDRVIDVNLKSVFLVSKHTIPHMILEGEGVIVNNSSCNGIVGDYSAPAYCASKGGVALLTKAMALDYAKKNIRINAICCGEIETPMFVQEARTFGMSVDQYRKELIESHPIGRIGKPEEAAKAVLFLASDDSSFITGTLLSVDGGYTAV